MIYKETNCDYCHKKSRAPYSDKDEYQNMVQIPVFFGKELRRIRIQFPVDKIMCVECRDLNLRKMLRGLKIQADKA